MKAGVPPVPPANLAEDSQPANTFPAFGSFPVWRFSFLFFGVDTLHENQFPPLGNTWVSLPQT